MYNSVEVQLKLTCCGCILGLCVATFLISIYCIYRGVIDDRDKIVKIYDEAIHEWNETRKEEFSDLNFSLVNLDPVAGSPATTPIFDIFNMTTKGGSILDHDYYGDLPVYDAMYYGYTGLGFGGHSEYD